MRAEASTFDAVANHLERISADGWTGRAADRFRERFTAEPGRWRDAAAGFRAAAGALEAYAESLRSAQATAKACAAEHVRGDQVSRDARAMYDADVARARGEKMEWEAAHGPGSFTLRLAPFVDPGDAIRAGAVGSFSAARAQLDRSAQACAQEVRSGCAAASPERNWLAEANHFMGSMVGGTWEALQEINKLTNVSRLGWEFLGKDMLGVASGDLTLEEAAMKKQLMVEDGLSMLAAAREDPVGFAKQVGAAVVDAKTWKDDPGRALGRLLPDAALTIASGGAGAAVKGGRAGLASAKGAVQVGGKAVVKGARPRLASVPRTVADMGDVARSARARTKCALFGDPVDIATGAVVLEEMDLVLPGVLKVGFSRRCSSSYTGGGCSGHAGRRPWTND
nr:DUF6531 domain-containing protein [Austwickia chelonae]